MKFNSGERDRRKKKTIRRKKGVQSTSKTPSRRSRPWGRRADDVPKEEDNESLEWLEGKQKRPNMW